jgi:hypothetical protein
MRAVERVGAVTSWNSSVLQSLVHRAAEENQDLQGTFLVRTTTWAYHANFHSPRPSVRPLKEHENRALQKHKMAATGTTDSARFLFTLLAGRTPQQTRDKYQANVESVHFSSLNVLN